MNRKTADFMLMLIQVTGEEFNNITVIINIK